MMSKQMIDGMYGYFRMVLDVSRRLIDQFPDDKLDFKPTDAQRTVAETVSHMYTFLLVAPQIVKAGKMVEMEEPKLNSKSEMLGFMEKQVDAAYKALGEITDEQLQVQIEAFGEKFAGWQFLTFAYDEHWHHRGALTVYLRLCGVEPLMIYDYPSQS